MPWERLYLTGIAYIKGENMKERDTHATIERFWRAHELGDPDALAAELHDDVVVFWPQSGERILGKANLDAINRHMPGGHPKGTLLNLRALGNIGILEMKLVYDTDVVYVVELLELKDGKICRATEYFANPFEAPAWRSEWVEKS
jgi:ketosteroid isomerase-like protein